MLKQLKNVTDLNLYNLGAQLLVEQALWLALTEQIEWEQVDIGELQAEIPLALPLGENVATKVLFRRCFSENDGYSCYLQLEDKNGPCKNSADKNIVHLAEKIFGEKAISKW